ncbi:MAG: hypothetical protein I3273_03055 [Candidatus Moeniiplasma glomeromycotorum]|nr:hypothetical protein [Candidatus Moeniiplasma glomeromycotorum]MCE8167563.1 hypothetical protein [Candidatus Moeniiplasma glomeromycotorum]MCE8169085.1 hypothetical protein [Candidatus Moeniiplasma glomeromycotorum]
MAGVEKMTLEELTAFRAKVGFLEVSGERLPGGWTEKNFGNEDRNRVKNYLQNKLNGLPREVEKKVKNKYPPATWKANIDKQNFTNVGPLKDTRLTKTRQDTVNIVNEILAFIYAFQQQEEYVFLINFLDDYDFTDSTYDNINWFGTLLRIKTAQQELEELSKDLKDLTKILNNLDLKKKRIKLLQEIYRLVFQDIEPAIINEILAQIEESFPNWRSDLINLKNKSKKKGLVTEFEELAQKVRRKTITLNLELNFIRALKFFGKRNSGTPLLPADLAEARGVKEAFRKVEEQETAKNPDVIFVLQSVMGWEGGEVPKIKTDLENYDREEYGGDKNYKTLIYKIIHELNMVVAQDWLNNLITNNINEAGEDGHADNGGRNIRRLIYRHTAAADAADDINGVLVGDIEIRDFPNLTEINFKGTKPHKSRLTRVTIINCPNLTKINVENNLLAANGLDLSQSGADGAVAAGLLFLDVSDNTNLAQLDLRGFVNLTQVDLQGTAIDTQQIKGISEIERTRNWNGGFNMGGAPLADGIQDKTFLNGVKAELNAKEVETARVVLSDLIGGGFTHAQFIAELIKNLNVGGAGATAALGGPLVVVVGDELANQDVWQTWVRRNPDHKIAALKVLKLLTIERITLPLYTKSDPNQIKYRLNAPNDQGGWNEGIADGVDLLMWLRNLNGAGGGADTVENLNKKERQIYDVEIQLQQIWDTQNEIETFITDSKGAFTDAHFKAELRKTIANGGADARAADDIVNDTHDLANTDGHDADDWKVWLNRDEDTLEEWRAKKRDSLKILARLRAITRLDNLRTELGINHIPFVQKLKLAANQGGIAAGGTAEDTEDNARDTWKALLNTPANAELVKELEAKMARSLGVVKGAKEEKKEVAVTEIETARAVHTADDPVITHAALATRLNLPVNEGGFNLTADGAGLAIDDNATARDAWLRTPGDDANATEAKKKATLKAIATLRAEHRLDTYRQAGIAVDEAALKTELGVDATVGAAPATWRTWLISSDNLLELNEREAKIERAISRLKSEKPLIKAQTQNEIIRLLTLSTLTDTQFKTELRKTIANGGADAANDATAGNTHDLANTANEREDWQNWLKRPADSDAEFTTKKTNSLRILHRVLAQGRISGYLAHGIVRTDNDLTTEIDKEIGTGEGVRNAGDPNITDWKVWLAQAPDLDEVMIREGKLMKAASAIKNSDYKEVLLKRLCDTIDKYNAADNAILAGKNYANIIENTYADTNALKVAVEKLNTNPVKYMEKVRELATKFYAEINKVVPTGSTKPRNEETPLDLLDQKAVNEQTWQKVKDVLPPLTPNELRTELITQGKFPGGTTLTSLENWVKGSKSLLTTIKAWADVTDTIQKLKEKPHIQQLSVVATELGITGTIDAAKLAPFKNAAGQVTSLQNQLNQATQAQTTLETKLGVKLAELDAKLGTKKLSDIPAGKTLQDLIENPDAPGLQAQIDQLNTKLNAKEKEVVKSIHDELQLGLASGEIDKTQVLTAIKNLIAKGGGGSEEDRAKITRLESEIVSLKSQPDTIVKEVIVEKIIEKEAEKTYGVKFTAEEITKISAAANAQEALTITNQIVKEKVGNLQDSQKSTYMLNWILGGLTAASLVALAYLLVKGSSSLPAPEKKEEKKN